ncbi:MAG: SOS response-associated peptidase [bacterium]
MCGRYTLHISLSEITEEFEIYDVDWVWVPYFNIAPGNNVPAVINENHNKLKTFRWGLIPSWMKEEPKDVKMINARAETLNQKPSFARILRTQRCIIPANGFYEWRTEVDKKTKTPFYIRLRSEKLMGFAGLYDIWKSPAGDIIRSCTIITTMPNDVLRKIHNRMPAIIDPEKRGIWLNNDIKDPQALMPLLKPYPAEELEIYEVSNQVNSPKFNTPDCIKPVKKLL